MTKEIVFLSAHKLPLTPFLLYVAFFLLSMPLFLKLMPHLLTEQK